MLKEALKELGFFDVYETAIGADMGAMAEAEHYAKEVATQLFGGAGTDKHHAGIRMVFLDLPPAFVGQFGKEATPDKIKEALKELGFYDVYETAIGQIDLHFPHLIHLS